MRYLLLKGISGLGNRLGALCTALAHARLTGRTLVVDWNDWMYSPDQKDVFRRLFDAPATPRAADIPADLAVAPAIWTGQLDRSIDWMIDRHGLPYGERARQLLSFEPTTDPAEPVAVFHDWKFREDGVAALPGHPEAWRGLDPDGLIRLLLREHVRPAARISARVDDFIRRSFGATTIGVHVRQSDNMSTYWIGEKGVSVAAIDRALAARLRERPGATIFLATDNRAVLEDFRARYPGLISLPKWYPAVAGERMHGNAEVHDQLAATDDALIDMLLLSRCDDLVYASTATFGRFAAYLSDLPADRLVDVAAALPDAREASRWIASVPWWTRLRRRAMWEARRAARKVLYRVGSWRMS